MGELGFVEVEQSLFEDKLQADKLAWEQIFSAKKEYLSKGIDPRTNEAVRPEVAESWVRSYEMGIDPTKERLSVQLTDKEFDRVYKKNSYLVEAAASLLSAINELDLSSEYIFELITPKGVSLVQAGDLNLHEFVAPQSIFDETTMGTCAHCLCARYRVPYRIVGPEHFSYALQDLSAVAAPIFDGDDELVATLLLTQPLVGSPWLPEFRRTQAHTLGLVLSLASAIVFKLRLRDTQTMLSSANERISDAQHITEQTNNLLDAAISTSKEGLLVVDKRGTIQHVSPEVGHILRVPPIDICGKSLDDFLGEGQTKKLEAHRSHDETLYQFGSERYSIHAMPIGKEDIGEVEGMILKIRKAKESVLSSRRAFAGDQASITFEDILGEDISVQNAVTSAKRFARTGESVLLTGESGTGKEYFAQAIHNYSSSCGPFVSINCAAIPPRLIESELFGYESGSFTGADRAGKPGKIELADGGTLFLDEIGDMPLELQAVLLRVLENKRVMRLGGRSYKQVDFRIIAATNKDLNRMAKNRSFREDLLYRLSVLTIGLPPLRDRPRDKALFAQFFLNECKRKNASGPTEFNAQALEAIKEYEWPGNVRQLRNAVISAFYSASALQITPNDLPIDRDKGRIDPSSVAGILQKGFSEKGLDVDREDGSLVLRDLEEEAIKAALQKTKGNVGRAAILLGISKATLYRKLSSQR